MKQILSILFLAFSLAVCQAKEVVWEAPYAFMETSSTRISIEKVEMTKKETVLHLMVRNRPHNWIRFSKHSFLTTPDGKQYAITSGIQTDSTETELLLDSLFWMPESGKANIALHFAPVPTNTKQMDFLESYNKDDFKFWNICDKKNLQEIELPDEWKNLKYEADEVLPVAKVNKGTATIKVKVLGYKKGMNLEFYVGQYKPLGDNNYCNKFFPLNEDGTLTIEIPLRLMREVDAGFWGMQSNIIIAPGQVTEILMKVPNDYRPFVAFKGFMAKTNKDLETESALSLADPDSQFYSKVKDCKTKEERMQCLKDVFDQRVTEIRDKDYTTATKDLLCMTVEHKYAQWMYNFAPIYCKYSTNKDGTIRVSSKYSHEKYEECKNMLVLTEKERFGFSWQYINEPGASCHRWFWDAESYLNLDKHAYEKNPFNFDLYRLNNILLADEASREELPDPIDESCKAVIREFEAEQKRTAEALANQENIFYKKLDDIAPQDILSTILDRYKSKVVLIDIWATWCGPCRAGHQAMKPMKEELKDKDIQFVYITSPSSPLSKWQEMIKDIDGDHYYLTKEQYNYLLDHYESNGIPTYVIYDRNAKQTYKEIGFPGVEPIKKAIEEIL